MRFLTDALAVLMMRNCVALARAPRGRPENSRFFRLC